MMIGPDYVMIILLYLDCYFFFEYFYILNYWSDKILKMHFSIFSGMGGENNKHIYCKATASMFLRAPKY